MKPLLFKNPKTEKASFHTQEDKSYFFYDVLHYHPELQLTAIIKSEGTFFVGDKIDRFNEGDVFILGSNLPHVLRNDEEYYAENDELIAHGVSAYFKMESFGQTFFELPEMHAIKSFLDKTSRGMRITGETRNKVFPKIIELNNIEGFNRLISLLDILKDLSVSEDIEYLSGISYSSPQKDTDNQKINDVFEFVMKNYHQKITLEEVADIAYMSPTAFCRFFKQRTRKTFSKFINEVRVGNACKLLMTGKYNISEICYMCGFNNISNFNRQFKSITDYTPSEYLNAQRNK